MCTSIFVKWQVYKSEKAAISTYLLCIFKSLYTNTNILIMIKVIILEQKKNYSGITHQTTKTF